MVLNSNLVVGITTVSANLCQFIACNPERLPSDQVLDLVCCLPLQQLGRLVLSLWTYLCYNPTSPSYVPYDDDDDDSHSD